MDFDADGDTDVLTGSWPGELYFFERKSATTFAPGTTLADDKGEPINAGNASTVFAVDYDSDNDLDLVLGDISGNVHVVINRGKQGKHLFGKPQTLKLDDSVSGRGGDSGPILADWDSDGRKDLIVAFGNGSVLLFPNKGTAQRPRYTHSRELVPKSGFGFDFSKFKPGMWGARVKVCAVDWNSDGKLDLLLGDRSGKVVDGNKTRHGYVWVFLRKGS